MDASRSSSRPSPPAPSCSSSSGSPAARRSTRSRPALPSSGPMQAKNLEELELQQPFFERTLRPLAARLSGTVARVTSPRSPSDDREAPGPRRQPRRPPRSADWLGIKAIGAVVGGRHPVRLALGLLGGNILIGIRPGAGRPRDRATSCPSSGWAGRVKARQKAILLQIPDALDLLTISVRAGLGFDAALGKVVEKMKGPLTDEFRRALAEVRVGKARRDALRDIIPRTEVPPLTNFIGAIIQAEQLGVSISKVLQVQSEQLRIERRQRAEEMAAKAPIKMLFPLVGLHLPVAVHRHPRAGPHPHRRQPRQHDLRSARGRAPNLTRGTDPGRARRARPQSPVGAIPRPDGPARPARPAPPSGCPARTGSTCSSCGSPSTRSSWPARAGRDAPGPGSPSAAAAVARPGAPRPGRPRLPGAAAGDDR